MTSGSVQRGGGVGAGDDGGARVGVDVAVIGGGVAGLWTLARLRGLGYSCVLVERTGLGARQTGASQGIIHGGIKYALTGSASRASRAIAGMPEIWRACLAGEGEVDLRGARVLSAWQHLWTAGGLASRIAGVAASRVIRTGVEPVPEGSRPPALAGAPRGIDVYRVAEPVLDAASVTAALAALVGVGGSIFAAGETGLRVRGPGGGGAGDGGGDGRGAASRLTGPGVDVSPRRWVLAAGNGNAELMAELGYEAAAAPMQRRPLHMVMARGPAGASPGRTPAPPPLFGHCVGASSMPRITVTSNIDAAGRPVWYIGGGVAEAGVDRSREEQIDAARREVGACLPWVDLTGVEWATTRWDRAEGLAPGGGSGGGGGGRPDGPVVRPLGRGEGAAVVLWPTKLAFAPEVAASVVRWLEAEGVGPSGGGAKTGAGLSALAGLARPTLASAPWDKPGVVWS